MIHNMFLSFDGTTVKCIGGTYQHSDKGHTVKEPRSPYYPTQGEKQMLGFKDDLKAMLVSLFCIWKPLLIENHKHSKVKDPHQFLLATWNELRE